MSEKPEGAMQNGQSRETVNTGHIRHGQSRETVNTGYIRHGQSRETVNTGHIRHGQSRETVNTGNIRHRMKTNNNKNTTQKTKKINNIDPTKNRGCTQAPAICR